MSTDPISTLPLEGKVAIVTGASRGIAGLAIEFARRGANAAPIYTSLMSEEKVKKIALDIEGLSHGSKAHSVQTDLKQREAPEKVVASTMEAFGDDIDILVHNAGILWLNPIEETTAEDYAGIFDVNVRAPLLLIKVVMPYLRKPSARIGPPKMSLYVASKAAIEGMTKSLAQEIGDAGHTLNAVAPRPVESEMLDGVPNNIIEVQLETTAVEHRIGTTNDIARIVGWLVSEDSEWVSGQTISTLSGFMML